MSLNGDDEKGSSRLPKLTRDNHLTWMAKVKDYILSLDHDNAADIWQAYAWEADPEDSDDEEDPAEQDYQQADNANDRKLRTQHNKAFALIRRSLSTEIFAKTLRLSHSVPKLLRFLQSNWNDGSVIDRDRLRQQYIDMKLSDYADLDCYATAFNNLVLTMREHKIGMAAKDDDVLFHFNKSLPAAWEQVKLATTAQGMDFEASISFYLQHAKQNETLPGTTKSPQKSSSTVHYSSNSSQGRNSSPSQNSPSSTEICRDFSRGNCYRGAKCRFEHVKLPSTSSSGQQQTNERPTCSFCGKVGHTEDRCWRKQRLKNAAKEADSAHMTTQANTESIPTVADQEHERGGSVSLDGYAYAVSDVLPEITLQMKEALRERAGEDKNQLIMVLDGASTVAVVQDESRCINVRPADAYIKVGGEGKPTIIHCTKVGTLAVDMTVDGRNVKMFIDARIVPGFGADILPECFFLKKNFTVSKTGRQAQVRTPDGKLVLQGKALNHDSSWLFYVELRLATARATTAAAPEQILVRATNDDDAPLITYALQVEEGERERQMLLPLNDEYDSAYDVALATCARDKRDAVELLLLMHKRMGHRNFREVADLLHIPLPVKLPTCISCIKGQSKKRALTGSSGLHDAPRAGYATWWDHAGPFKVKTWAGNNYLSLKGDVYSGKLFPRMTNSTGTCYSEWRHHVLTQEARAGKQAIAQMITDSAPYFMDRRLQQFNEAKGIIHVQSPPYTQELNGLAERTLGTILSMTRTSLEPTGAPGGAYGECMMAQCVVLDTLLHRSGGKLSRLEKWHGRLLPRQHERLKVWGCAVYLHVDYGTRGKIGDPGKLDPRAELYLFVGYDSNGMGYRIASLPGFKLRTALHVTFVEEHYPCRTSINRELGGFMSAEMQRRFGADTDDGATPLPDPRGRVRPHRLRTPSATALEIIAAGDPSPPDHVDFALAYLLDDIYETHYDTVYANTLCPRNIAEALAGPDADRWLRALAREVQQHEKNCTFGPPIAAKDLPPGRKAIPVDVVLKIKRDGTFKVRCIIKGFHMIQGLDFNETFAPVPCMSVLRLFLALATHFDWEIKQGDVSTAFLAADMDSDVTVALPNWFRADATGAETGYTLRKLIKAVPGIPQGPRLWHKKSHGVYTAADLSQCKSEPCLYFCTKRMLFLIVWVDDLFLFFPKQALPQATALWKHLQANLDLGDWQDIDDCLACTVHRDRPNRTLTLSQEPAARKLLLRLGMQDANPADTPMVANSKLSKTQCPSAEQAAVMADEQRWYRSTVASFIYLVGWTRPDMAFAVSKLCKFMHNPGREHIIALKRLIRYLKATADYGLKYDFSASNANKPGIYGYYDASHADCPDTRKSTLAYLFLFSGCPISWNTKLHTYITTSTNHSEYCAAAKAAREAKLLEKVMLETGFGRYVKPIDLFSDSKGAIAMAYNPVQRAASKHVDLADHYAREQQERGTITISYVSTRDMTADIFTKPLARSDFTRHAARLVHTVTL